MAKRRCPTCLKLLTSRSMAFLPYTAEEPCSATGIARGETVHTTASIRGVSSKRGCRVSGRGPRASVPRKLSRYFRLFGSTTFPLFANFVFLLCSPPPATSPSGGKTKERSGHAYQLPPLGSVPFEYLRSLITFRAEISPLDLFSLHAKKILRRIGSEVANQRLFARNIKAYRQGGKNPTHQKTEKSEFESRGSYRKLVKRAL